METDEDKDRLTLETSELAAPLQLTTHQSEGELDTSPRMRPADH